MSTPIDVGAILSSAITALINAITSVVNVLAENIGAVVSLAILGAIVGGVFYLVKRFGRSITGWFRGFLGF